MYRVLPLFLIALALACFAAAPALAVEDETHEGTLVKVDDQKQEIVMKDKDGKEHIHKVAKDAKITCDDKACKLAELKKDLKIKVTMDKVKKEVTKIEAKTN